MATGAGWYESSMPTAEARYQSAGAVHMASRSPKPGRLIAGGASARVGRSMRRASGHREGTVLFVPSFSNTDISSEKALTEAAVWTTTSGGEPLRRAASLHKSVMVP